MSEMQQTQISKEKTGGNLFELKEPLSLSVKAFIKQHEDATAQVFELLVVPKELLTEAEKAFAEKEPIQPQRRNLLSSYLERGEEALRKLLDLFRRGI